MAYDGAGVTTDAELQAHWDELQRQRALDPRAYFNRARAEAPVEYNVGDNRVMVVNRDDVEAVLRNPVDFSSAAAMMGSAEPPLPVGSDAPEHTEYRRLLDPFFSPRKMAALDPIVTAHVNRLIDGFINDGETDFSQSVAVPLPCATFLSLFGWPLDELDQMVWWKDVMIRPNILAGSWDEGRKLQMVEVPKIYARLQQEIDKKRAHPGDDLISWIVQGTDSNGEPFTDSVIRRLLFQAIAGGLDTVTSSLQLFFHYLATHPQAQQMIADEPEQINNVIEELLRWETPVMTVGRVTTRDVEISGCPVAKGTRIGVGLAGGNIDPAIPGAMEVNLRRGDKAHLAFGGGPHRCLGSHLARMEMRVVLREWHKRIPQYEIKPDSVIDWIPSEIRGIEHLWLSWPVTKG